MKNKLTGPGFAAVILIGFFPLGMRGDEPREIASFQGKGTPLNWVALSPDGTRLAAAATNWIIAKNGKGTTIPGEVVIWDLNGKTQVSSIKEAKANFNHVGFSADGKSLLTVHNGAYTPSGKGNVQVSVMLRAQAGSAYQVWDVETGKPIGSPVVPSAEGEFTTVALSPDGKYLATVFNEMITDKSFPTVPFKVREVTVWNMAKMKVEWRLPGFAHKGRVTWMDGLAFSPDGKRLAFSMSGAGGPRTAQAKGRSDRPQESFKPLIMLSLEDGQSVPQVVFEKAEPIFGSLSWSSGGRSLIIRNDRAIERLDPANGEEQDLAFLPWPRERAADQPARKLLPTAARQQNDQPTDWYESFVTLSADGKRAAAHQYHQSNDRAPRENYVVFWNAQSGAVLGSIRLPGDPFTADGDSTNPTGGQRTRTRIALSGDGMKLAVSDLVGAVRVYDVSGISGLATAKPGTPPPGNNGPPAPDVDIKAVRQAYEEVAVRARENMITGLDRLLRILEHNAEVKKSKPTPLMEPLRAEKAAFEKNGRLPWSEAMRSQTGRYLREIGDARAKALASLGRSPIPDDLRKLINEQVVARWTHLAAGDPAPKTRTLYSSGLYSMDEAKPPDGDRTWSYTDGRLTFRFKNRQAPGGYWIDTCGVSSDGLSYAGANQIKRKCTATLVTDD
jgi:hypothetical protein